MAAVLDRPERTAFAPAQRLLLAALLPVIGFVFLTWIYLSSPWLGLSLKGQAETPGVLVTAVDARGPAAGLIEPGQVILQVVGADGTKLPLDGATISPEGGYALSTQARFQSFFARHRALYQTTQTGSIQLELADGKLVQLAVGNRPLASVPIGFWIGMTCGLLGALVGAGTWVFRPQERATRHFALHGFAMFFAASGATVINHRDITLEPTWFLVLTQANLLGVAIGVLAIAALVWCYPRPINRLPVPKILYSIGLAAFFVGVLEIAPSPVMVFQLPVMLSLLVCFPVFSALQWRLSRDAPADRAALLWFMMVIGITMTIAIGANLMPVALSSEVLISTSSVYALILLMYVGLAFGVIRYRLFNLGEWWFAAMMWGMSGLLVILLDAILLTLNASLSLSLAISLMLAGWLYFPLRQWLWRALSPEARQTIEHYLPELIETLFTARSSDELLDNWRLLLERVYRPLNLQVQTYALAQAELDQEGLVLRIPSIKGAECIELSHGHEGRRLFTSADVRLADAMRALTQQAAVLRQAEDEQLRMAAAREREKRMLLQDLHDGVGGLTTNIALIAEVTKREEALPKVRDQLDTMAGLAREALAEVRNVMHTLDDDDVDWRSLCANLRFTGQQLLLAHGIEFSLVSDLAEPAPPPDSVLALNLYRLYKECLTNVVKHAQATEVRVEFTVSPQWFELCVEDNGVGWRQGQAAQGSDPVMSGGQGLRSLHARAAHFGGEVEVETAQGTRIRVRIPLPVHFSPESGT